MAAKLPALIKEKDGVRGLVPSTNEWQKDKSYIAYLNTLHPRENADLQIALAQSSDNRFKEFLSRLQTTRYSKMNPVRIAKACGISLAEFNAWWQKASSQRAIAVAQSESIKITQHMAIDAESTATGCPRCDGLQWVAAPADLPGEPKGYRKVGERVNEQGKKEEMWIRDCPNCNAAGYIRKPGDAHARDKILTMAGVLPKTGGIMINQNFGVSHGSAISDLDSMNTIDLGPSDVIDIQSEKV